VGEAWGDAYGHSDSDPHYNADGHAYANIGPDGHGDADRDIDGHHTSAWSRDGYAYLYGDTHVHRNVAAAHGDAELDGDD
jgi:hypothetical protein